MKENVFFLYFQGTRISTRFGKATGYIYISIIFFGFGLCINTVLKKKIKNNNGLPKIPFYRYLIFKVSAILEFWYFKKTDSFW